MNKIKAIAEIIVTVLVGVPLIVTIFALAAIWYLTGGFIVFVTYLCIDTINVIFGGDPETFWRRNSRGWETIRGHMIETINLWFN